MEWKDVGIGAIVQLPGSRHGLMMFRQLFGSIAHRLCGDFEVLEEAAPGFHRVCSDPPIPVKFVDREVAMLDGRQDRGESHILHMSVRPELQPVETHRHAPGYPAAESPGKKIRDLKAAVVDSIATTSTYPGRMKL